MKLKKLLTGFLAATLVTSSFATNAFAANFADMNQVPYEQAKPYINAVADAGLMVGDTNASGQKVFRPLDKVTYCETMQLVYAIMKTYTGKEIDTAVVNKYATVMNGYKIPSWAHPAVAYGLENGIVTISDIPGFVNSKGVGVNATRQDVAIMLGRALKNFDTVNANATLSFTDKSSVASVAVPYVDLLYRLKIFTGDDKNNFNPKNYINRTETAIVISKAYDIVKSKGTAATGSVTGTVTAVESVGSNIVLSVSTDKGVKSFKGSAGLTCISGQNMIILSNVVKGDKVLISYDGQNIKSLLVTEPAGTAQPVKPTTPDKNKYDKYDEFGYLAKLDEEYIRLYPDATSLDAEDFDFIDDDYEEVTFYIDDEEVTFDEFKEKVKKEDMIGLMLDKYEEVEEVYLIEEEKDDYDEEGYFYKVGSSYIRLSDSKNADDYDDEYDFKNDDYEDVTFYVDDEEVDFDEFKEAADTKYKVGIVLNANKKVTKVYLTTTKSTTSSDYDKEGYFYKLGDDYIRLSKKADADDYDYDYDFKDGDYEEVKFYIDGTKVDYDDFDDEADTDHKVGVVLNDDEEVTKLYLITKSKASYDVEGYLYRLRDDCIRLTEKSSSSDYTEYDYKNADYADVTFYIDGDEVDYDDFEAEVGKGDEIGLIIKSNKVTKVYLLESGSGGEASGEIKSATDSVLKLRDDKASYLIDSPSSIDIDVVDGQTTITDYDDLLDAINNDEKWVQVTIDYDKDNNVTDIEGYVSHAYGELTAVNTSLKTFTLEYTNTSVTYKYTTSTEFVLDGYADSGKGLENLLNDDDESDKELEITIGKNGKVTVIEY